VLFSTSGVFIFRGCEVSIVPSMAKSKGKGWDAKGQWAYAPQWDASWGYPMPWQAAMPGKGWPPADGWAKGWPPTEGVGEKGEKGAGKGNSLDGKPYKDDLIELTKKTALSLRDFDVRALALMDLYEEKGKREDSLAYLAETLGKLQRDNVSNWKAYVHTLLRKANPEIYQEFKAGAGDRRDKKTEKKKEKGYKSTELSAKAVPFVPGKALYGDEDKKDVDKKEESAEERAKTDTDTTADTEEKSKEKA